MRPSWRKPLRSILAKRASDPAFRLAVVGIGNELHGDDGAGVIVARRVVKRILHPNMMVIEGATAPEAFTGPLRRFHPSVVLLVDIADLGGKPGAISFVVMEHLSGWTGNSHTMPPTVLADFLIQDMGCEVALLAIQPKQLEFGEKLSSPIQRAVARVVHELST